MVFHRNLLQGVSKNGPTHQITLSIALGGYRETLAKIRRIESRRMRSLQPTLSAQEADDVGFYTENGDYYMGFCRKIGQTQRVNMINFNTPFLQNFFIVAIRIGLPDIKNGMKNNIFRIVDAYKTYHRIFQFLKGINYRSVCQILR